MSAMRAPSARAFYFAALGVITLAGGWLRLRELGTSCLWLDEVLSAVAVRRGLGFVIQYTHQDTGPLPLSYFFEWLALRWRDGEFWLRLPTALFGAMGPLLAAGVAYQLTRDRISSLSAAFLLAFSNHHLYYSGEARGYALAIVLALLAFALLQRALESNRAPWWIGFTLASLAGLYTTYFYGFTQAALALYGYGWLAWGWLRREQPGRAFLWRLGWLTLSCLTLAGLFLPWVAGTLSHFRGYQAAHQGLHNAEVLAWLQSTLKEWLPAKGGFWPGLALLLGLAGGVYQFRTRRGLYLVFLALMVSLPTLFFRFGTFGHFLHPRYLVIALPFFLIAVAAGIGWLVRLALSYLAHPGRPGAGRLVAAVWLLAPLALLGLYAGVNLNRYAEWAGGQKQNWRGAARVIQAGFQPGDLIIPSLNLTSVCLSEYLPPKLQPALQPNGSGTPPNLLRAAQKGARIWYVAPEYCLWDNPRLEEWLNEYFTLKATVSGHISNIKIYLGPKAIYRRAEAK